MKPNNKNIHFFDLDGTLWNIDSKVWILDKEEPHKPIIRLDKFETNKIVTGQYKKDNQKICYNGDEYYISHKIYDKIRKKKNLPIERLGISWIEFYDNTYINNTKSKFLFNNIKHLRGTDDLVCILTGRAHRDRHPKILNELRLKLQDIGIEIYKIYFVSDKFYNKINDEVSLNKSHILIEHLVGLKIENGKFMPLKQDWFNNIYFYDDERTNIYYANDIQKLFDRVLKNTDDDLFKMVINRLNNHNTVLNNNLITNNDINRFETTQIVLKSPTRYPIKMNDEYIKNFKKFIDE